MKILQKACFRARAWFAVRPMLRRMWWQMQGARFGAGTRVPALDINWPHQVRVGARCQLEPGTVFKFDGVWKPGPNILIGDGSFIGRNCEFNIRQRIEIGRDALIASGCKFIDHDHGFSAPEPMKTQHGAEAAIFIEQDVWLGANVLVLKGVTIGRGAIVAAGAVVTKSVGAGEIWGGVPARKIGARFVADNG